MTTPTLKDLRERLRTEVGKVVVGQREALDLLLIALICEGHVLLEGVPGVAKTTLARALAEASGLSFKRVQFTPDLMPGDVLGTQVYDFREQRFQVVPGPIFTQLLLVDEINRAPAKTQAALLEAMQEGQVSLEGESRPLPRPFMVVATRNPIEQQGTYPMPEAQLDRFLFRIAIGYPDEDAELRMLSEHAGDTSGAMARLPSIEAVADVETIARARAAVVDMQVADEIRAYVLRLVRSSREHEDLQLGASPRAGLLLQLAARTAAVLDGRDYVIPDDVKRLWFATMEHRVVTTAAAEIDGRDARTVLEDVLASVPVPR